MTLCQNYVPKSSTLWIHIVNLKKQLYNMLLKEKKFKVFDVVNKNKNTSLKRMIFVHLQFLF